MSTKYIKQNNFSSLFCSLFFWLVINFAHSF